MKRLQSMKSDLAPRDLQTLSLVAQLRTLNSWQWTLRCKRHIQSVQSRFIAIFAPYLVLQVFRECISGFQCGLFRMLEMAFIGHGTILMLPNWKVISGQNTLPHLMWMRLQSVEEVICQLQRVNHHLHVYLVALTSICGGFQSHLPDQISQLILMTRKGSSLRQLL